MASTPEHTGITDYSWRLIYPSGYTIQLPSGSHTTNFCINNTGLYKVGVKEQIQGCSWSQEVQRSFPLEDCGTDGNCGGGPPAAKNNSQSQPCLPYLNHLRRTDGRSDPKQTLGTTPYKSAGNTDEKHGSHPARHHQPAGIVSRSIYPKCTAR